MAANAAITLLLDNTEAALFADLYRRRIAELNEEVEHDKSKIAVLTEELSALNSALNNKKEQITKYSDILTRVTNGVNDTIEHRDSKSTLIIDRGEDSYSHEMATFEKAKFVLNEMNAELSAEEIAKNIIRIDSDILKRVKVSIGTFISRIESSLEKKSGMNSIFYKNNNKYGLLTWKK